MVISRRFKRYVFMSLPGPPPPPVDEFHWELQVLLLLEEDVYPYLEDQGVPTDLQDYYVYFAKRLWERRVHFNHDTFQLEKESLLKEFSDPVFGRGLELVHLQAIQAFAEARATQKITRGGLAELPGVTALGGNVNMAQLPGVTVTEGVPVGPAQLVGVTVFADESDMVLLSGVTVVKGTVT